MKKEVFKIGSLYKTNKDNMRKEFAIEKECQDYVNKCSCKDTCNFECKEYKNAKPFDWSNGGLADEKDLETDEDKKKKEEELAKKKKEEEAKKKNEKLVDNIPAFN